MARENNTHYVTGAPVDQVNYELTPVTPPGKGFYEAADFAFLDDGTSRVLAVSRFGYIFSFRLGNPSHDLRTLVSRWSPLRMSEEEGIMGVAVDPDFEQNGYFYVHYVDNDGTTSITNRRISIQRFKFDPPSSNNVTGRTVIFTQPYYHWLHQGGGIRFGPDGYLYFAFGEGVTYYLEANELNSYRGKIMRIDVHTTSPGQLYSIPPDNPFINVPGAYPEIWARGFRNPFRMHFDRLSGKLYVGNVGFNLFEEIEEVQRGGHHGWPYFEGPGCSEYFFNGNCNNPAYTPQQPYVQPLMYFPHAGHESLAPGRMTMGSIINGFIYRGDLNPELRGAYIFGDFSSRTIRMYRDLPGGGREERTIATGVTPISIVEGLDHEIYVMEYSYSAERPIFRLDPPAGGAGDFPYRLSDAPWLRELALGNDVDGVLPYDVNVPLWSDGAGKTRFLAVPNLEQATYTTQNSYHFPEHTTVIKNFYLDSQEGDPDQRRPIETRLLIRRENRWDGYSYAWNDDATDAELLPNQQYSRDFVIMEEDGESTYTKRWTYPSRNDCFSCHTDVKNTLLGLETLQLNGPFTYPSGVTDNQLRTLNHIGLFREALSDSALAEAPALPRLEEEYLPMTHRVKAYLHANCAMCHQPGGVTPIGDMDLRYDTPLYEMGILNVTPISSSGDLVFVDNPGRVRKGLPDSSVLLRRMLADSTKNYRMPPLARREVDSEATELIEAWIRDLGVNSTRQNEWLLYH